MYSLVFFVFMAVNWSKANEMTLNPAYHKIMTVFIAGLFDLKMKKHFHNYN